MHAKAEHDDGDREELEEDEVLAAIEAFAAAAPAVAPGAEVWRAEGHTYLSRRVLRSFDDGKVEVLGTIVKWLEEDKEEPALFRVVHDDGDEEDLEEEEVIEAMAAFDAKAFDAEWRTEGHQFVGCRVARTFEAGERLALT